LYAKGIFRKASQRPYQRVVRQKFVVHGVAGAPGAQEPGFISATRSLRQQLRRERPLPSIQWRQRRIIPYGVTPPPVVQEPGYIGAIKQLRKQLGRERPKFDVRWQLRRNIPFGVTVPAADIGWLVNWMIRRGYGHNLRR
jgi:hypothetical protein